MSIPSSSSVLIKRLISLNKIRTSLLARYPHTLLADDRRLRPYWRPHLNAYFLSRDLQMFERVIWPFYTSTHRIERSSMNCLTEKTFREELTFYDLLDFYQVLG